MLRALALGAVAATLLVSGAASASLGATLQLSNPSAGAHGVAVTIVLRDAVLQCGQLDARSLSIRLPGAMPVPRSIPTAAVRVEGRTASSVETSSGRITVSLASSKPAATCDSIVEGKASILITGAARLANPARTGTYAFAVKTSPRGETWRGSFVVS